ncbi:MAG TPA: hypothetical protein VF988_09135, partial [Verrucomicrobiae bacterium]
LNARGVSLRRLTLPAGTPEELSQRLRLQVEAEFPLSPDELAWGWQPLGTPPGRGAGKQDVLVAAIKKDVITDYRDIFRACGTEPIFTLAACARQNLCPPQLEFALLDIGAKQSELSLVQDAAMAGSRLIFWGQPEAAKPASEKLDALVHELDGQLAGKKLFVCGRQLTRDFVERLEKSLAPGCRCEHLDTGGKSAAIAGLQRYAAENAQPPLQLSLEQTVAATAIWADSDWKKWAARAGALAAAVLLLPYGEALLLKPHLARKVADFKAEATRLAVIDRELEFLRDLKQSQPPYLELLSVFSKSVPPGTHFDSLSLNSHGEMSLRCIFRDGQQVADFRNKLIDSGFFTNVVVEEQSPTPDRQRVNVRLSAQEKPLPQLQALAASLPAEDKPKDTGPTAGGPTVMPRKEPK